MINIKIFQKIAELILASTIKEDKNYAEFLEFYKNLVTSIPTQAVKKFGNMSVKVTVRGETKDCGLELTVTDYVWWKQEIEEMGARFTTSPVAVQSSILNNMSKNAEIMDLSIEDRKELLEALGE